MATIVVGVKYDPSTIAAFWQVSGQMKDPYSVEVAIFDAEDLGSESQVWPDSGYADITTAGRLSKGLYAPYDEDTSTWWAPDAAAPRLRLEYRIVPTEGADAIVIERWCEVVLRSVTLYPFASAVLIRDVREAGLPESMASDSVVSRLIGRWTNVVNSYARRSFTPAFARKSVEMAPDCVIYFDDYLSAVQSVTLQGQDEAESDEDVELDNTYPDRLKDCRLILGGDGGLNGTYYNARHPDWTTGSSVAIRAEVAGVWGVFDPATLLPPADVRQILLETMVKEALGEDFAYGPLRRSRVDAHEVEYAVAATTATMSSVNLTINPRLEAVLAQYRSPAFVGYVATA